MLGYRLLLLSALLGPMGAASLWILARAAHVPITASADPAHLAIAVLIVPWAEEVVFRGGMQPLLQRCRALRRPLVGPVDGANVATSVLFASCHLGQLPAWLAASLLLPSLLLGCVRQRYGSLTPCFALHAWFNVCFATAFAH